jgi:hypothetical protein
MAEEDSSSMVEITALVSAPTARRIGEFPVFLGMHGCMDLIRFAVDPEQEKFYFGSIGGTW